MDNFFKKKSKDDIATELGKRMKMKRSKIIVSRMHISSSHSETTIVSLYHVSQKRSP